MENRNEQIIWQIIDCLPDTPPSEYDLGAIWQNGDEILCKNQDTIQVIAFLFEYILDGSTLKARTGYHDPNEDAKNNEIDDCTGYHYVRLV